MPKWLNDLIILWPYLIDEILFCLSLLVLIGAASWSEMDSFQQLNLSWWASFAVGISVACYPYAFLPVFSGDNPGIALKVLGGGSFIGLLILAANQPLRQSIRYSPLFVKRFLILTDGQCDLLSAEVLKPNNPRYKVEGIISVDPDFKAERIGTTRVLGSCADLYRIASRLNVRYVVVAMSKQRGRLPFNLLLDSKMKGIKILEWADFYERVTGKIGLNGLRPSWLIFQPEHKPFLISKWVKRLLDISLAGLGLIISSPCWIALFMLRKGQGKGLLINLPTVGEGFKTFKRLAFNPEIMRGESGLRLKTWHMDKLPSLINVLRGEMSIVGPKPDTPESAAKFAGQFPLYNMRFKVKPGLYGLASVNQADVAAGLKLQECWEYDLYYAKRACLWLDLKVSWKAVNVLFSGVIKKHTNLGRCYSDTIRY
jgi:lipopolysaccharide/colanic/teichoic acid biosynthesis glycosyltransferase